LSGATLKIGRTGAIVGGQGTCVAKWRVRRGGIAQTAFAIDGRRLRDADFAVHEKSWYRGEDCYVDNAEDHEESRDDTAV
jgi:hypothetical protein